MFILLYLLTLLLYVVCLQDKLSVPSSILPYMTQNTIYVTCITTQDIKNEKILEKNWCFYRGITIHALVIKKQQYDCFNVV